MFEMITGLTPTEYAIVAGWVYVSGVLLGFGQTEWRSEYTARLLWPLYVTADFYCWALSNLVTYFFPAARCVDCGQKMKRVSYVRPVRAPAGNYLLTIAADPLCRSCWEDAIEAC